MGKGLSILILVSISTIILCGVMIYLMSTLNPKDVYSDKDKKVVHTQNTPPESSDEFVRGSGIYFDDDSAVLPIVDTVQYGLDKIILNLYRSTEQPEIIYQSKDRKVIPPLWPRAVQNNIGNPSIQKLLTPIWPTTLENENSSLSSTTTAEPSVNTTDEDATDTIELSARPVKRRSVNNYVVDEDESAVILKILDDNGESKIEVKVWSDIFSYLSEQNSDTKNLQKKFRYTLTADTDLDNESAEIPKHTVVKFCVNDSVVNKELVFSPRNESDKNVENTLEVSVVNTTHSDHNSSAEILINKTETVEGSLSKSIDSNSNMSILKHAIPNDSNINITDTNNLFNILFNTNTNNTEFLKGLFGEELNNVQVNITRDRTLDKDKISITDSYPNNITGLVIKGDSDMSL